MDQQLLNIFGGMGHPKILLIGDFMLDRYVYSDAERINPEAPVPVFRVVEEKVRVGGTGSVAANLRALQSEVVCVGIVGDDADGNALRQSLKDDGVDVEGILSDADRPTTTKTRHVGLAQHRHPQQILRVDREETFPISGAIARRLLKGLPELMARTDLLCLEDYDKGLFAGDLAEKIIGRAKQAGKKVVVDPARLDDFSRYAGADVITPNRSEAARAAGCDLNDYETAAQTLLERHGFGAVVITLDREGAWLARQGQPGQLIPTRVRGVYDNTGAGDAVLAMMGLALAEKCDLADAVGLANVAGGLEVERFGCVPITREEVLGDLLRQHRTALGKVRRLDQLLPELALRRRRGEKIVFTNGCFDLLHVGHISYLGFAREQGDLLVVGLNSDASVTRMKGPTKPVCGQQERAEMLAAIEGVDYVVVFEEDTPLGLIEQVRPDVLVKGEDWREGGVVGREFVEGSGGKVILAKLVQGKSTTALIERIVHLANKKE